MLEYLTIVAIVTGPLAAILTSWWLEGTRERKTRRMDIFRTLMRTRRTPMWAEHVGALNLVEIEFKNDHKVLGAWKKLFEHLAASHARHESEQVNIEMLPATIAERDRIFHKRLYEERQKLLAKLLHAIARSLNFKADQLEIFEGGYSPQGWDDLEMQQHVIRQYVLDLYSGRRVVPVGVVDYTNRLAASAEEDRPEGSEKEE